jgi:hypothetical protein
MCNSYWVALHLQQLPDSATEEELVQAALVVPLLHPDSGRSHPIALQPEELLLLAAK